MYVAQPYQIIRVAKRANLVMATTTNVMATMVVGCAGQCIAITTTVQASQIQSLWQKVSLHVFSMFMYGRRLLYSFGRDGKWALLRSSRQHAQFNG